MEGPKTMSKADRLTQQIGVLTRREVEARIVQPLVEALGCSFGREAVIQVVGRTIVDIARGQGADLATAMGGNSLADFKVSLEFWSQDNALEIEMLHEDACDLQFNVRRCRYAEMYRDLGMAEMGCLLSCNRDYALIEGFNPAIELRRTQTIMEGADFCDFRYRLKT